MSLIHTRRETILTAVLCLFMAALLLLLCSQSSPLYPINLWNDANCLFTVGRVMRAGGILYRDIYEQKGPTLYLFHYLAACISDTSFWGVYVMETFAMAATLFLSCRLLRQRLTLLFSLAGTFLSYALLLTSRSFARGDSAEEFCLPFLVAALYITFGEYRRQRGPMRPLCLFLCGLMAGFVATIKYTVLGLFVGLCLCEGILALREGGMIRAIKSAIVFLAGMAAPCALWCAYLAANRALSDFFTAYIYNNIFLYGTGANPLDALIELIRIARNNKQWTLSAAIGVLSFTVWSRENSQLRACMFTMAACAALSLFLGRLWTYSTFFLGALIPIGLLGLWEAARRLCIHVQRNRLVPVRGPLSGPYAKWIICIICTALSLLIAANVSPNAFLRGVPLSELAQGKLAALMPEGSTLLQYSHLDDGLYLASDTLPQEKFFVLLNVRYPEMLESLNRYVAEGEPDFVLITSEAVPQDLSRYELFAYETGYDNENRLNKDMYLYKRIDQ